MTITAACDGVRLRSIERDVTDGDAAAGLEMRLDRSQDSGDGAKATGPEAERCRFLAGGEPAAPVAAAAGSTTAVDQDIATLGIAERTFRFAALEQAT